MASKGFNYSKWDNIELSDDESDLHPNIDKDSWFRLKHRTRLEREEKEDQEIEVMTSQNAQDTSRLNIINARVGGLNSGELDEDAEFEDVDSLKDEAAELKQHINERNKRMEEITERRKWNIDNICKVSEEKTVVNSKVTSSLNAADTDKMSASEASTETSPATALKPYTNQETSSKTSETKPSTTTATASAPKPPSTTAAVLPPAPPLKGSEPAATLTRERFSAIAYNDFAQQYEEILETYSEISDMDATKEYLFRHCDILMHEHSQSYMLLSSLEDEMNGKKKRMKLVCRQSQILSHIQELGQSMHRDPRDVIIPFFKRIEEKGYLDGFLSAVTDFEKRIVARSVEKRKEMDAEKEAERAERIRSAGGDEELDPYEVLMGLPTPLKDAFESQDIGRLQGVLAEMDPKEAKKCMKRCVDSGLWVAKDSSVFDDEEMEEEVYGADGQGEAP